MFSLGLIMLWLLTNSTLCPAQAMGFACSQSFFLWLGNCLYSLLSFAGEAIYPTYIWAPRIINLDPLNDQILGGIIMKVVNMGFSLTILAISFYNWARSEEVDDPVTS